MMARVWNMGDVGKPDDALYIGRPGKGQPGKWGNPFALGSRLSGADFHKVAERMPLVAELDWVCAGAVIDRERSLILHSGYVLWAVAADVLDVRELVTETDGVWLARDMVCFCAPKPCHGDYLLKLADAYAYYRSEPGYDHTRAKDAVLNLLRSA